jgi:hypothetical protein
MRFAAAGDLSFEVWVAEWTDRATTEIGSWQGLKTSVKGRFNAFSGTGVYRAMDPPLS